MNFSSHQKELLESIEVALSKGKLEMCSAFIKILQAASSLYHTKDYDFWIQQIQDTPVEEIPVTRYGHQNAGIAIKNLKKENRHQVQAGIVSISEGLFTYSNENDICPAQSDYHFYYDLRNETIYKESELGFLEGVEHGAEVRRRIARVSELQINAEELYY